MQSYRQLKSPSKKHSISLLNTTTNEQHQVKKCHQKCKCNLFGFEQSSQKQLETKRNKESERTRRDRKRRNNSNHVQYQHMGIQQRNSMIHNHEEENEEDGESMLKKRNYNLGELKTSNDKISLSKLKAEYVEFNRKRIFTEVEELSFKSRNKQNQSSRFQHINNSRMLERWKSPRQAKLLWRKQILQEEMEFMDQQINKIQEQYCEKIGQLRRIRKQLGGKLQAL